jgi:3-hydroxyacyl-[acyl-carrier-protein] dehydratase
MSLCSAVRAALTYGPEKVGPDSFEADFFFDNDFAGFDGHFPDNPLLPGVVQIMASALAVAPDGPERLKQIGRTKFLRVVQPGDGMKVRACCRTLPDGLLVDAECSTHNGTCAQIKFLLEKA